MKYISHMTIAHDDSKIQALRDRHGLAGYGAYWIIIEKIAAQVRPESPEPELTLSLKKWALHLDIRPVFASKLIRTQHELGLIRIRIDGEKWTLTAPNILKYADEYTKKVGIKSRQTRDKVPTVSGIPAYPALPEEKKDLKDLRQPVDNSKNPLLTDGANDGGDGLGATPPSAPRSGLRGNGIHPRVRALNLPSEKEVFVSNLYQRHQAEKIRGDDISDALRGAGLDQGEVFRVASLFIGG